MQNFYIYSFKYGVDVPMLFMRRIKGVDFTGTDKCCAVITTDDTDALCNAVCDVLLYDIAQFELADIINELPLSLNVKKRILTESAAYAKKAAMRTPVKHALYDYFSENTSLVLEGFILFRMRDTAEIWERCTERAAEDVLLSDERKELAQLLQEILMPEGCRIVLLINEDGSASLSDDAGTKIDYPTGAESYIMSILIVLSPSEIKVFDRSGGLADEFIAALIKAFPNRTVIEERL